MNTDDILMNEAAYKQIMQRFGRIVGCLERLSRKKECFDGDTLLDNFDMCKLLNVTKRTLARYRQKKLVKYYMIDRKVYYKATEVQEFLKRSNR